MSVENNYLFSIQLANRFIGKINFKSQLLSKYLGFIYNTIFQNFASSFSKNKYNYFE